MKRFYTVLVFCILSVCLHSQEIIVNFHEEAKKIEKTSSFFSIVVYEKSLETQPEFKTQNLNKLFDLYLTHSKLEDLILLKYNHTLDKAREERYFNLKKNLANNIGIEYDRFEEFLEIVLSKNSQNRKKNLSLLYCFISLIENNERTVYLTLIKSNLITPIIPIAKKTLQKKTQ